jgi:hypothetical protein
MSGEADGRAMIAKASIPPRTDDRADERRRITMRAEATAGLLKRPLSVLRWYYFFYGSLFEMQNFCIKINQL